MIDYRRAGKLPRKPHTAFRDDDGALLHEQCFTRGGFDGPFSILYHRNPPQNHGPARARAPLWPDRREAPQGPLIRGHLRSAAMLGGGTPTTGRRPLLFNDDLTLGAVRPVGNDAFYFANGEADDVLYIHRGGGTMWTWFGRLDFGPEDYVVIPRGVPYRIEITEGDQHWFWIECRTPIRPPAQYRNPVGQLRMDAPYTHRDFRAPEWCAPEGNPPRMVVSKRAGRFTEHPWPHPVVDTVGWDGTVYPFVFPIRAFSPKAGQVHLPPTVHGTFATGGSLICSFVPRVVDFGEGAIPCPYPHSNVDVDEVIFYCDGDFTSRRGVEAGSITLHPAGIPHGPHPGAYEASIGVQRVGELAVMIDTFQPLRATELGRQFVDPAYDQTWKTPKEDPA